MEDFIFRRKATSKDLTKKYYWAKVEKINIHYKRDHDLEVILKLKWGLERHCYVFF